jgi:rubredoxin-NAD+ reductase
MLIQNSIIIIGSGLAGYVLAKEFRNLDKQTPLQIITKSSGHFYSKPLLSTALAQAKTPETLPVSDANIMAQQLTAVIRTHTEVTAIDPKNHCVSVNGGKIFYSRLILACGADVIKPPIIGNAVSEIHSINDLEDYASFRSKLVGKKHVAIFGAGLVGCEFANDLAQTHHQVDVISPANYPVDSLLPECIGLVLQQALEKIGVSFHFGQTAISVDHATTGGYAIQLSSERELQADIILSAIGLRPRVTLAETAGIKTSRGILVNQFLQTSEPDVYALGDCAEINDLVLLFVAPLLHCARALAKTLAGDMTKVIYPAMPVVIKTPACPIAVCPQPRNLEGNWEISGEGQNLKALFYDKQHQLRGFALTGKTVSEKTALLKELPAFLRE